MNKTQEVIHQNYVDESEKIYCRLDNKVVKADYKNCSDCPCFFGALQGEGVECKWKDNILSPIITVTDPVKELMRVSKLIDKGIISKN